MVVRSVTERSRPAPIVAAVIPAAIQIPSVDAGDSSVGRTTRPTAIAGELYTKNERTPLAADTKAVKIGAKMPKQPNLDELAAIPSNARDAWKNLDTKQRTKVLESMEKRYGADFVGKFKEGLKTPGQGTNYTYGPGVGPSAEKLEKAGYKPYWRGPYNEIWVHPGGDMVQKVVDTGSSKVNKVPAKTAVDPLVEDAQANVEGMKSWLDSLKSASPKDEAFEKEYTDFWVGLTKERDDLKAILSDPNLDATVRAGLEKALKGIEGLNTDRANSLKDVAVHAPSGSSIAHFNDWLYILD